VADIVRTYPLPSYGEAINSLLAAAETEGEATPTELRTMFTGVTERLRTTECHRPEQWLRYLDLILCAIRP
jgi:hypothetical protein